MDEREYYLSRGGRDKSAAKWRSEPSPPEGRSQNFYLVLAVVAGAIVIAVVLAIGMALVHMMLTDTDPDCRMVYTDVWSDNIHKEEVCY